MYTSGVSGGGVFSEITSLGEGVTVKAVSGRLLEIRTAGPLMVLDTNNNDGLREEFCYNIEDGRVALINLVVESLFYASLPSTILLQNSSPKLSLLFWSKNTVGPAVLISSNLPLVSGFNRFTLYHSLKRLTNVYMSLCSPNWGEKIVFQTSYISIMGLS